MRPDVDKVDLFSIRELSPAEPLTPDGSWLVALCNPATGISYKADQELIGAIISSYIGSGIVIPDRTYRIGGLLPVGVTVGVEDGKGVIYDPYLDGKVYSVNRRSVELMDKGFEWDNTVDGGGIRLLSEDDTFSDGEIIIIQFQPQISPIISTPDAIARFTSGVQLVSGDTTLTASTYRKLIVITGRGVITLGADYPENVICAITQNTTGDGQSTITAPDGQFIAYNGTTVSVVWLGKNERIGLTRSGDTWYVAYEQTGNDKVGTIVAGRLRGPNQIIAQGQTILRADYPRVFDYITRLNTAYPGTVLTAGSWPSAKWYWGFGDGSTTIQVPDLRGYFPRWLDLGAGIDADRVSAGLSNKPGSGQSDKVGEHEIQIGLDGDKIAMRHPGGPGGGFGFNTSSNGWEKVIDNVLTLGSGETRGINIGELPLIYT